MICFTKINDGFTKKYYKLSYFLKPIKQSLFEILDNKPKN